MASPTQHSRAWYLTSRPTDQPRPEHFALREVAVPPPGDGQALVRNQYLSVEPHMLGCMRGDELAQQLGIRGPLNPTSELLPYAPGEPMFGPAVGEVIASRTDTAAVGTHILHTLGWREHALLDADHCTSVDPRLAPLSAYLGVLGLTGLTAYAGITREPGSPCRGIPGSSKATSTASRR